MRALILAAGKGERLRPLTATTPKPMLELGGRPLIHYPIAMLRRAGITEVAINVHHLAGRIQSGLGDGSRLGVRITYAPERVLLGTGGPLNGLRDFLGIDTFVIANSDTILDLDLAAMIRFHRARGALGTIALFNPANAHYYSRIEIDADARIRRMRLLARRDPIEFDDYPKALDDRIA
ncbi:MAG: nucleotidyltransferase family protein, partial [Candidatus Binatus sp.]|uniref:nucleotidyltransferase family protein n=1 Tax=Candidatus Binatus sp. TaxID=2811406 RepID=UPI002717AC90